MFQTSWEHALKVPNLHYHPSPRTLQGSRSLDAVDAWHAWRQASNVTKEFGVNMLGKGKVFETRKSNQDNLIPYF